MPSVVPMPASAQYPLSSAERAGTEYSDLVQAGYIEEEYYLAGIAPAITAAGDKLFQAPYITRILVRRPKDPARFNGTAIIEPFSWFGERGAGWILTRRYLLREGYAYVGYTLNINQPEHDPKFTPDYDAAAINRYRPIVNLEFMRRFDYARYAPLGFYYDPARFVRGDRPDPFVPQSQGVGAQLALLLKSNASSVGWTRGRSRVRRQLGARQVERTRALTLPRVSPYIPSRQRCPPSTSGLNRESGAGACCEHEPNAGTAPQRYSGTTVAMALGETPGKRPPLDRAIAQSMTFA